GFTVYQADNGKEAIEKWKKYKPDLLWMDMRMPVMDGYEATRAIRKETHDNESPTIIALTASAFEHERRKVINAGCNDFMSKPFHENDLFDKIAQHLGIEFVYEEEKEIPMDDTTTKLPKIMLNPSQISEETRALLIRAAESLSFNDVQRAVALVPEELDPLKKHINLLAQEFDFGAIIDLLSD
ncbi:MAG: response regulator, partial [Anaerolineae bacterium]|nr:response regulator [Anaerolineae bacterium]